MTPLRLTFLLAGLALTAACATTVRPVEVAGLDDLRAHCTTEPPVLSDEAARALADAMPAAEMRERKFWAPRDQDHRTCELYERDRADSILRALDRFNEAVRR